jgi:DNA-binding transcriptional regulator YiaG
MSNGTMAVWHHREDEEKDIIRYKGCGLDDVYLASGYEFEETPYGHGIRIKNLDSLHAQIGLYLAKHRKTLIGKEIRFLRHQMDLTQSELARLLGCNSQQVARYEKDQNKLTGPADRVIRILFEDHVAEVGSIREKLDTLDKMDDIDGRLVFTDVDGEWRHAA